MKTFQIDNSTRGYSIYECHGEGHEVKSVSNMARFLRPSFCFLLFCSCFLNLVLCSNLPKDHVAFFIFGDSLFDPGNNNYINTIGQANYYPYGETFFKHPTGRFSDGRLIPDFIAKYANLPFIPPYLPPGKHELSYGVNFASAGAGALSETAQGFVIDLKTQLIYFKDVAKSLSEKLGDEEAKALISKAVYLFHVGANDYPPNTTLFQAFTKQQYVNMVVGNLTDTIKEMYKQGGRKFGILKLGTLGCLPSAKALIPGNTGACFEELTDLAKLHNVVLSEALEELENKLTGLKLAKHEFNTSTTEITNNPEKYGFKEVNIGCCGSGPYNGILSCGGKRGIKEYTLCSDPNEYWFFDSAHLTDKANGLIAKQIWSGGHRINSPYNLKQLFEA
ncbi:Lipase, GDSL [Corchorus olitorius]|uniref:Lipase, GDSL n=1 Tax=Corchorus olitorius TaxID=93759 RepID=A0A1R3H722_9ROSI|nr:Lipase, GDSL [Corchorus olitorius]